MMTTNPSSPTPGKAEIRFGTSLRRKLSPGEELTFGRGPQCDLRVAHSPEDDLVSRLAGTLTGLRDGVLIRNNSATQPLLLQVFPGPERTIDPGEAVATLPHDQLHLVICGRNGSRYSLVIDTRGLRLGTAAQPTAENRGDASPGTSGAVTKAKSKPTRPHAGKITPRELNMLAALCEPMLTLAGAEAVPASRKEIAFRLGSTTAAVKTCLTNLRTRLSVDDGIPGLRPSDDEPGNGQNIALARWAIHSGTVSRDTLTRLNSRSSKVS